MVNFRKITEENFDVIIKMKRPDGEGFVASNAYSLAQAWLYRDANDVYPFAIYNDDEPVGFMLLDEDLEERYLVIWRIMFPVEYQNKGYGSQAIGKIVQMAKESGKYDYMIIDYVPENRCEVMGMYLNIGNDGFQSVRKGLYVDKSGLISFINSILGTKDKLTCVRRLVGCYDARGCKDSCKRNRCNPFGKCISTFLQQ